MCPGDLIIGESVLKIPTGTPEWDRLVTVDGEQFFRISGYDRLEPFLMNIVSHSDHWMFISSTGGLTAGRKTPELSVFPFESEDNIHHSSAFTGSFTIFRIITDKGCMLWEPFSSSYRYIWETQRNLYKNPAGNKVMFEEINYSLGMTFRYTWMNSEKYGWVRKAVLKNISDRVIDLSVLDGIRNIQPYGRTLSIRDHQKDMAEIFIRNELEPETGVGIFGLSAVPPDRIEANETLKVTAVWGTARQNRAILLSEGQVESFRLTGKVNTESFKNGKRGSYLVVRDLQLQSGTKTRWYINADVAMDHVSMTSLIEEIKVNSGIEENIEEDVQIGINNLRSLVALADGIQVCDDPVVESRHFAGALFNIRQGGIFFNDYLVDCEDYEAHLSVVNQDVASRFRDKLDDVNGFVYYQELCRKAELTCDADLIRLTIEYLPLTGIRNHAALTDSPIPCQRGSRLRSLSFGFKGNWTEIFQSWEALAYSYPGFIPGMIFRLLNSLTVDGYNAFRISKEGIEWDVPSSEQSGTFIGYGGDQQIGCLLNFLELTDKYYPELLANWLDKEWFVFANVPFRIKTYSEILEDPSNAVWFDSKLDESIRSKVKIKGADAKFLTGRYGEIAHTSLTEKLLIALLTRLGNFIPGGGIWINTQNADRYCSVNELTGCGISMVTTYQINRLLNFLIKQFKKDHRKSFPVSPYLVTFLKDIMLVLNGTDPGQAAESSLIRKKLMDKLGIAGSIYRQSVYSDYPEVKERLLKENILEFLELAGKHIRETIRVSIRKDGLYNTYNLLEVKGNKAEIVHLEEMLEGQVAILGACFLSLESAVSLLENIKQSSLYDTRLNKYHLFPARVYQGILEKNNIAPHYQRRYPVIRSLLKFCKQPVFRQDMKGNLHFNGDLNHVSYLKDCLTGLYVLNAPEKENILGLYNTVFKKDSIAGKSNLLSKKEDYGNYYWFILSELLYNVASLSENVHYSETPSKINLDLKSSYYSIRQDLGLNREPSRSNTFPTDPCFCSPVGRNGWQPGLSGRVKEEMKCRMKELGVLIHDGTLHFKPFLINEQEFIRPQNGEPYLIFSICSIKVVYYLAARTLLLVKKFCGDIIELEDMTIPRQLSNEIFSRSGLVESIEVYLKLMDES